jgi:hypothetical protein
MVDGPMRPSPIAAICVMQAASPCAEATLTVIPKPGEPGEYYLVCGQGRLEAFRTLGQVAIPALAMDAT